MSSTIYLPLTERTLMVAINDTELQALNELGLSINIKRPALKPNWKFIGTGPNFKIILVIEGCSDGVEYEMYFATKPNSAEYELSLCSVGKLRPPTFDA